MIKTLAAQIKEFKKESVLTPIFMVLEVVFETLIPLMMASIIDDGVEAGNMRHIYMVGGCMIAAALGGLFCGIMGGKFGARASTGFARNLRQAMFDNIQSFSFSNLDKFSTAGLVTRLTTDVTDAPAYLLQGADQHDLCDVDGVFYQRAARFCLYGGACPAGDSAFLHYKKSNEIFSVGFSEV